MPIICHILFNAKLFLIRFIRKQNKKKFNFKQKWKIVKEKRKKTQKKYIVVIIASNDKHLH